MSTFKNITGRDVYIQGFGFRKDGNLGIGAQMYLEKDETFVGCNYYDRFTYEGMIANGMDHQSAKEAQILKKIEDDEVKFNDNINFFLEQAKRYALMTGND